MNHSSLFMPLPAHQLRHNHKTLELSVPQVMGILNVTPDSFSDGGHFVHVDKALAHVQSMIDDGASIIDIGAESTRPNAQAVSDDEQLVRLSQIVSAIRQTFGDSWISIDTSSPVVMAQMHKLGADIWNDVRGLTQQGAAQMAAQLDVPVVIMHARGEPDTMNQLAHYKNVHAEVIKELSVRIDGALQAGVRRDNIIIDVGMGFAKNFEHHKVIMRELTAFMQLGYPMLFGVSRKRFLGEVLTQTGLKKYQNHAISERDGVGAAAALLAVQQGASIIRTHQVAGVVQALALWQQLSAD